MPRPWRGRVAGPHRPPACRSARGSGRRTAPARTASLGAPAPATGIADVRDHRLSTRRTTGVRALITVDTANTVGQGDGTRQCVTVETGLGHALVGRGAWRQPADEGAPLRRRGHRASRRPGVRPRRCRPRRPWRTPARSAARPCARSDFPERAGLLKQLGDLPARAQGGAVRAVVRHRGHPGATPPSTSTAASARCSPTPPAAGASCPAATVLRRRPGRAARPARQFRRTARPHPAARRRGAGQRLQLPGLGDAREARARVPRRRAVGRQAGRARPRT